MIKKIQREDLMAILRKYDATIRYLLLFFAVAGSWYNLKFIAKANAESIDKIEADIVFIKKIMNEQAVSIAVLKVQIELLSKQKYE